MVCGDFNSVMDNDLDILSGQPHCTLEVTRFKEAVQALGLSDVWRIFNNNEKEFTWCRYNPFIGRRLDYCFASEDLLQYCVSCNIFSVPSTDHRAVIVEMNSSDFVRGPGYWRFNNAYLKDECFVSSLNVLLNKLLLNDNSDMPMNNVDKWELCKVEIREFCMEYGRNRARNKKNRLLDLQLQMQELEKQIISNPDNEELHTDILRVKQQLEAISLEKARGAQVRARIKWIEEGERNTKYFLNLEKSRGKKNVMTRIIDNNGKLITNQTEVLEEQVKFYSTLYSQNTGIENIEEVVNDFIHNENFPKLEEDEALICDGLITHEEAGDALKSMKNGSAPGSDGLTVEFFKCFWEILKTTITNSYNESLEKGEMSYSQKQGIIILLHKGNDLSRENLNNWRPITLTNTDYKILAKVLARRLDKVIGKLINQDQVGYLKGRSISTVLRTIDDVIQYLNCTDNSGFLLALDYRKAFDSIARNFMLQSFKVFGFGEQFRK